MAPRQLPAWLLVAFALVSPLQECRCAPAMEHRRAMGHQAKEPLCEGFPQFAKLNGSWVDHPDPEYQGLYNQRADCPAFATQFDCKDPHVAEDLSSPELIELEYRKVFEPEGCALRPFDGDGFARCLGPTGRMIMVGGSSVQQAFLSLACLMHQHQESGSFGPWLESGIPTMGNYTARGHSDDDFIRKLTVGDMRLKNGAQVSLRSFGRWNITLWDDVMTEFGELMPQDVIFVNFGGWCVALQMNHEHIIVSAERHWTCPAGSISA